MLISHGVQLTYRCRNRYNILLFLNISLTFLTICVELFIYIIL